MRFIDLFAGLGGFHVALKTAGHECVFACEKNKTLALLYEKNFGIKAYGDIQEISAKDIPPHDILCAGFPCQPFSKAGKQRGLKDKKNGGYFIKDIVRILEYHKPRYIILENVPHLRKHDRERTWQAISSKLNDLGYNIKEAVLSPHEFGIPQIRKRLFIVGSTDDLNYFSFPEPSKYTTIDIKNILDKNPKDAMKLNEKQLQCMKLWQRIIEAIPKNDKLPTFPIWSMEFGATYPFEEKTPHGCTSRELEKYCGTFGKRVCGMSEAEQYRHLPSYAKTAQNKFPEWKQKFIRQNREFYRKYKKQLKPFIPELKKLHACWQKLEWNCSDSERKLSKYLIQFRASGIRIKKTNYAPSLVLTTTQRPIIGWENRYITVTEASRLQSLERIELPENQRTAIRALGNAVNATVVSLISQRLILRTMKVNSKTAKKKDLSQVF